MFTGKVEFRANIYTECSVVQCSKNSPYNSTQNISDYRVKNKEFNLYYFAQICCIYTHMILSDN